MKQVFKRVAQVLGVLLAALVLLVGGYIAYLQLQYYRIEDGLTLEVLSGQESVLQTGDTYTAVSCNLGFGAYGPDYSFFMDTGVMADGTPTQGLYGKAQSRDDVLANTSLALETLQALDADFLLLQEVDYDSHRSFQVDQREMATQAFPGYGYSWAENFHSGYLAYPLNDPHGAVNAGLLTLSRYAVEEAERRSYPIDNNFFLKFTDLDRCFSVSRLPVEGTDRQLVLIHNHMSAYDSGGVIRAQQLELLDDASFARQKAAWMARRNKSPREIRMQLARCGVDEAITEAVMEELFAQNEEELSPARQAILRLLERPYAARLAAGETDKVKAALARRGFTHEDIRAALAAWQEQREE